MNSIYNIREENDVDGEILNEELTHLAGVVSFAKLKYGNNKEIIFNTKTQVSK